MLSRSFLAAALLAAGPVAQAAELIIHNSCNFPVYLWSVDCDQTATSTVLQPGNFYTEQYRKPSAGGVSVKLSKDSNPAPPITQVEYTLKGPIWYDLSNVNCDGSECPFMTNGMYMESGQGCPTRTCAAGETPCHGAYTQFNDDWNSLSCDGTADVRVNLCAECAPKQWKRSVEIPLVESNDSKVEPMRVRRHVHAHAHAHAHHQS